jgi:hypothetical protein
MLKAEEIIDLYWGVLHKSFPYEECRILVRSDKDQFHDLVPDLDSYGSFIAGYSLSASKLGERAPRELSLAIVRLRQSFFEEHPEYLPLIPLVTEEMAPALYLQLMTWEEIRWSLIELMQMELDKGAT